jgi:hypothetical protein
MVSGVAPIGGAFLPHSSATAAIAWAAIAVAASKPFIDSSVNWRGRGSALLSWTLAMSIFAAALGYGANEALDHPVVHSDFCRYCDVDDLPPLATGLAVGLAVLGTAIALGMSAACEKTVLRLFSTGAVRRTVGALAWCALGAGVALSVLAARATLLRPNPVWTRYLSGLPIVTRLPPVPETGWAKVDVPQSSGTRLETHPVVYEAPAGDLRILAVDSEHDVAVHLARRGETPSTQSLAFSAPFRGRLWKGSKDENDGRLIIRRDAARGLIFVETPLAAQERAGQFFGRRIAFQESTLVPVDVGPMNFVLVSAPPWPWVLVNGLGLAIALVALLGRPRSMAVLAHASAWRLATCDGAGLVTFADGTTAAVPSGEPIAAGPAIAVVESEGGPGNYRGSAPAALVVPGTAAQLRCAIDQAFSIRAAYAISAIAITSAPLAVAAWRGFV